MDNTFKTFVFMALLTVLLVLFGRMFGGQQGMIFAFILALVMNFGSYWFSDKLVLAMYRAREVNEAEVPELYNMVRRLSAQAGLPMPRVYIIPQAAPNAFATGRNPEHAAVAVTQGIMQLLSPEELEGVLGHELAHIKNRDILIGTIAATLAGAITLLADMARWSLLFGGLGRDDEDSHPLATLALMILAPLAALLIQMAISRAREYQADREGAAICGRPQALARALEALEAAASRRPLQANPATAHMFIVNPLRGGGIVTLFSTHPPIKERIRRLLAMAGQPMVEANIG